MADKVWVQLTFDEGSGLETQKMTCHDDFVENEESREGITLGDWCGFLVLCQENKFLKAVKSHLSICFLGPLLGTDCCRQGAQEADPERKIRVQGAY